MNTAKTANCKNPDCRHAEPYLFDFMCSGDDQNVPQSARQHIKNCSVCKDEIEQLRILSQISCKEGNSGQNKASQAVIRALKLHLFFEGKLVDCQSVRLFLSSLADPALQIVTPTPITVHIDNCPQCANNLRALLSIGLPHEQLCRLGEIFAQNSANGNIHLEDTRLQKIVEDIISQPPSGIVTRFCVDHSAAKLSESSEDDPYAAWPITVEVLSASQISSSEDMQNIESNSNLIIHQAPTRRVANRKLKPFRIPLAAAVLLLVIILASQMRTASAVDLSQIYEAIAKIKNLCSLSISANDGKVMQKRWISRSLQVIVFKTGDRYVLWDLPNKVKKSRYAHSETITMIKLSEETISEVQNTIEHAPGLVPFTKFEEVQEGAQWSQINDKNVEAIVPGSIVYELKWAESDHLTRKWRVFLDIKTFLPMRTEHRSKDNAEEQYLFSTATVIKYVDQIEIEEVIQKWFTE